MKNLRHKLISMVIVLIIFSFACNFSASTANFKDAYTARNVNGEFQNTSSFSQDEVFYCLAEVANAPDDTLVKAIWYAVDAEGVDPNFVIDEAEFTGGGEITFDLSNDQLWPAGKYKIELYLNDKLDRTLEFEVIPATASAPATSTASVTSAYMARDNNGETQQTTVFDQDDVFYFVVDVANATESTSVKAFWYAVDAEGIEPNFLIEEVEFLGGGEITFDLSNNQLWPLGDYRVEVTVDGFDQGGLDFQVNQ